MHIEHKQFLELLADAAGLELEKAEKQLTELVNEIKQSLSEGEAYEIDGFGIFSSLGNRVMFIPSNELETEINFKYVGMEPIELDEPKPTFEDPFAELDEQDSDSKDEPKSDTDSVSKPSVHKRFSGLIDDDIKDPDLVPGESPGPEMWGVDAHSEDDGADRLFASLMGQDYKEPLNEEEGIDAIESDETDDFSNVFEDSSDFENGDELGAEVAAFMAEDDVQNEAELSNDVVPDDGEINDEFVLDADEIDELSTIEEITDEVIADDIDEPLEFPVNYEEFEEEPMEAAPILEHVPSNNAEFDDPKTEEDINDLDETIDEEIGDVESEAVADEMPELEVTEEFDDPFLQFEGDDIDESVLRMEDLDDTEIIPVIKNITTEISDSKKAENEAEKKKKEKDTAENEAEKKSKEKPHKEPKKRKSAPAWLWVFLLLIIVGGSVVGLAYLRFINIPFITPQTASNTPTVNTPVAPPQQSNPAVPVQEPVANNSQNPSSDAQEQAAITIIEESQTVKSTPAVSANQYGLTGQVSEAGINGYTIILYTLSNQQNAINERQKLLDAGYRGFLTPIANERYGTLHRVSVGQFRTLFDAAVAAEEIEALLPENYIIKKIN